MKKVDIDVSIMWIRQPLIDSSISWDDIQHFILDYHKENIVYK